MSTALTTDIESDDDTAVSPELDAYLRAEAIVEAINKNLPRDKSGKPALPAIPKEYVFRKRDREAVSIAFHAAFENIGGVAALMQWAQHEPGKFFALYSKLLQSDTVTPTGGTQINIISSVPQSPLDLVNVAPNGQVYSIGDDELPE